MIALWAKVGRRQDNGLFLLHFPPIFDNLHTPMEYDKELIKRVAVYVKAQLYSEHTGHDWYHVRRVLKTSQILQNEEGGSLMLVELSSLLHDLGHYKRHEYNEAKGNLVLDAMMDILEIDRHVQKKIMTIVHESQYRGDSTKTPTTIEGKILQDSDWLETLGALGIARAFATGGSAGKLIYSPEIRPRTNLNQLSYQRKKTESTSFNYFFEKSLNLPNLMNTETGRRIATQRVDFLKKFIRQFIDEWEGKK